MSLSGNAGPATGGAVLAHTVAGLIEGRRPMATGQPCRPWLGRRSD